MRLAEFIAGEMGTAFLDARLNEAMIPNYIAESQKLGIGTDRMGEAGNGDRKEDEW